MWFFAPIFLSALLCSGLSMEVPRDQKPLAFPAAQHDTTWSLPVALAWIYMSDDQDYDSIPSSWSDIDFSVVDVLNVGPFGVQSEGSFGLFNSSETGALSERFKWVLERARSQNADIKVIASQWWGEGHNIWGSTLSVLESDAAINHYASSVASFLDQWSSVAGGVDGYDIDYEDGNVLENTPKILAQVRERLHNLSENLSTQRFYVTVSPSSMKYLDQAVSSIDYVNIQTYQGGSGQSPDDFIDIGFDSKQLLYGTCPETDCGPPSVEDAESAYTKYLQDDRTLAGIHLWRLNSENYVYENEQQAKVHAFLHPHKSEGPWSS